MALDLVPMEILGIAADPPWPALKEAEFVELMSDQEDYSII